MPENCFEPEEDCPCCNELPQCSVSTEPVIVEARFTLDSRKALRALEYLEEFFEDMQEDFSYREDVKKAQKAYRYLVRRIEISAEILK